MGAKQAARRASVTAAENQKQIAKAARGSCCCARFFCVLRFCNLTGALAIMSLATALLILSGMSVTSSMGECGTPINVSDVGCRRLLEDRFAVVGIDVVLILLCCLTVSVEWCRATCVARNFGFMARDVGKGAYSVFVGLGVAWYANFLDEINSSLLMPEAVTFPAAAHPSSVLLAVGVGNACVGALYLIFGCCDCIALDPVKAEFRDYQLALKRFRAEGLVDNEGPSSQVVHCASHALPMRFALCTHCPPCTVQVAEVLTLLEESGGNELVALTTRTPNGHLVTVDVGTNGYSVAPHGSPAGGIQQAGRRDAHPACGREGRPEGASVA